MGPRRVVRAFVFETVGVAFAGVAAFVGLGLERAGTFDAHGLVDEEANALGYQSPVDFETQTR